MSFVIFDTEYTSWQGCQENGWRGNQKKEVVQISALKISDTLDIIAKFTTFCRPTINPVLSDYFINLTHITNEDINEQGVLFSEAYENFTNFAKEDICYSHSWGTDFFNKSDGFILEENLRLYNLSDCKKITYRNIAAVFKQLYLENHIAVKSQSSGQIADILGLKQNLINLGLNPHNALYDVYSIFEGLKYFYPKSVKYLSLFEKQKQLP